VIFFDAFFTKFYFELLVGRRQAGNPCIHFFIGLHPMLGYDALSGLEYNLFQIIEPPDFCLRLNGTTIPFS